VIAQIADGRAGQQALADLTQHRHHCRHHHRRDQFRHHHYWRERHGNEVNADGVGLRDAGALRPLAPERLRCVPWSYDPVVRAGEGEQNFAEKFQKKLKPLRRPRSPTDRSRSISDPLGGEYGSPCRTSPWQLTNWHCTGPMNIGVSVVGNSTSTWQIDYTVDDPTGTYPNPTLGASGVTVYSTTSGSSTPDLRRS
jgi:hypothetical protein